MAHCSECNYIVGPWILMMVHLAVFLVKGLGQILVMSKILHAATMAHWAVRGSVSVKEQIS
jgi:uncharacterized membrane protein YecN with MAPEG domain